jgi:hypothetical protein
MSKNLKLYSKWNWGILLTLIAAPILGHAGDVQVDSASVKQNSEIMGDFTGFKKISPRSKGCENGKDGRDGRDCPCDSQESNTQIAYFYLTPSSLSRPDFLCFDSLIIPQGESIQWDSELFTIKSNGINVKSGFSIDLNDPQPFNFFTTNDDIVISKPGVYRITYSVFANASEDSAADSYTMELQINDSPVPGSRYTATLGVEEATVASSTVTLTRDAARLTGQVVTYIPAGSNLELVNVGNSDIRFENESKLNGVVASILIEKIADSVN